jgi:hypothetical protein
LAARKNKAKNRPALEITQTRTEIACSTQFFSSLLDPPEQLSGKANKGSETLQQESIERSPIP